MPALITEPTALFAFLAGLLGLIFWLSTLDPLKPFFERLPPVIWAYFVPMIATTLGITPAASPVYDWVARYLLPLSLFLLMLTVDVPAIIRLGPMALAMMAVGTLGIVIGGPVAYLLFGGFLPPDAWQGFATLSGSWIGGTANMVAIQQSVGAPDALLGPIIVVDTVVGYGWMGVLIFLSSFQERFDQRIGARTSAIEAMNARLAELDTERRIVTIPDLAMIVGLAFAATALSVALGGRMPALGDPTIISQSTWAILIAVTLGLLLSFTPMRRLERPGASRIGYLALYLLLTTIGAKADLAAVLEAPIYLLAGVVWIAIHIGLLFLAAKLLRAPLFFVATGSMANIGGAASAPVVAGVYHPAMAPVGLLMAVAGYILGIYAALACAGILGWMAGG
ncbi:MAG: DUF819 domain-containing protein [Rhodothermales bacterium]